jgi:hypothetical protein
MQVVIAGRRVRVDPARLIGSGGEAEVFDLGAGTALKLYKTPEHPDLAGLPVEQEAARRRLAVAQRKLPRFPAGLPERVVAPRELARDRRGAVCGFTMPLIDAAAPLLRYADRRFRQGIPQAAVTALLLDLHATLAALHARGVVVGDLNDVNVLARGGEALLIDADSFQWDDFPCPTFTEKFVDPLKCDPAAAALALARPHDPGSDWYAFAALVLQSFLGVGPYGGVYLGRPPLAPAARPLRRITVFCPEVRYPRPAIPWSVLPDELLHHLQRVFVADERGGFPERLLRDLAWRVCPTCRTEHARPACPLCRGTTAAAAAVAETVVVRGEVTVRRLATTRGTMVAAAAGPAGELLWLCHEDGAYRREDGRVALAGPLDPGLGFALLPGATRALAPGEVVTPDGVGFVVAGGQLLRRDPAARFPAPETVGEVLGGSTRLWLGPRFGLGLSLAGGLTVTLVFDLARRGIADSAPVSARGEIVDAAGVVAEDRAWLLLSLRRRGRAVHECRLLRRDGTVAASAEAEEGDGSWLGGPLAGKHAAGGFLLCPTDEGIVRVEPAGAVEPDGTGGLIVARRFPDTAPFVDSACHLVATADGLAVVDRREIRILRMHAHGKAPKQEGEPT